RALHLIRADQPAGRIRRVIQTRHERSPALVAGRKRAGSWPSSGTTPSARAQPHERADVAKLIETSDLADQVPRTGRADDRFRQRDELLLQADALRIHIVGGNAGIVPGADPP